MTPTRQKEDIPSQIPVIVWLLNKVGRVAETDTRVLVLGETGVGKGLLSQTIHLSGGAAVGSVG